MKKESGKHIAPVYVDTEMDLKCAVKTKKLVIVSSSQELFVELENLLKKKKASTKVKKGGSIVTKVGTALFAVSLFIPGVNGIVLMGELAVAGVGGIGKLVGSALDDFKNYAMVADYTERRVVLLRVKGSPAYNSKLDTIDGIDIKKILKENDQ